jgi:hypothetical protein
VHFAYFDRFEVYLFNGSVAQPFIDYVQTIGVGWVLIKTYNDQPRHLKWRTDTAVVDGKTTQRRVGPEKQKQRGKGRQLGIARSVAIVHTARCVCCAFKQQQHTCLSPHTAPVQPSVSLQHNSRMCVDKHDCMLYFFQNMS